MSYYLKHYFDPDFNHEKLSPLFLKDGEVNHYYLGYVQNVVAGQVLAEVINLEEGHDLKNYDPHFISVDPQLPCGTNCSPHPDNHNRIIATANGYCFYHEGLITVKKLLNVRHNINFHTGNILFLGDVLAHGSIKNGFTLQGDNVLVNGTIEGATVKANSNLVCKSGIKGSGRCFLQCGGNLKLKFCENTLIMAQHNVEIEGSCMHSDLYVGGSILIKSRLQGGSVYANNIICIKEQLGGRNTQTQIIMGYNPSHYAQILAVKEELLVLNDLQEKLTKQSEELKSTNNLKLRVLDFKIKIAKNKLNDLTIKLEEDRLNADRCRIVCPGVVDPEVKINIGGVFLTIQETHRNVEFRLKNDQIEITSLG